MVGVERALETTRAAAMCWIPYFRLHRMHEMPTIFGNIRSVCLSVTQLISASLCKNGRAVYAKFQVSSFRHSGDKRGSQNLKVGPLRLLFGVHTPEGPWNIVLDASPDPLQRRVCSAFDAAFAKLRWPLVSFPYWFYFESTSFEFLTYRNYLLLFQSIFA